MKLFRSATAITKLAFAVAFLSLLTLVGVRFVQAAWAPPTSAPPGGNTAAPLNVSGVSQTKQGSLTIGGEFLSLSGGDALFAADDRGIFWGTASDPTKAHIEYAGGNLYISPGETGVQTEIQGDVRIAMLGSNAGSLMLDNTISDRSLALTIEPGAQGVDIKSYGAPLFLNYDGGQKVQIGSNAVPVQFCLNDDPANPDPLKCISNWGGGLWTLTGDALYPQNTAWKVGVGTATPADVLHIVATPPAGVQDFGGLLVSHSANPARGVTIGYDNVGDFGYIYARHTGVETKDLRLGNSVMTITKTGRVGINTTTPNQELGVSGDLAIAGGMYKLNGTTKFFSDCAAGNSIRVINADGTVVCEPDDGGAGGSYTAENGLTLNGNAFGLDGGLIRNTTITQGNFSYTHNLNGTGDFLIQDNGVTRFEVRDDGGVYLAGVGPCNGASTLDTNANGQIVCGTDDSGGPGGDSLWAGTEGADINPKSPNSTKVRIGWSGAGDTTKLSVIGEVPNAAIYGQNHTGYAGYFSGRVYVDGTGSPSDLLHLRTNGDAIVVGGETTDNIGLIGVASNTSPNQALTLEGKEGIRLLYGGGGTESMRVDSAGKVGVGLAAPAYKLDVADTLRLVASGRTDGVLTEHTGSGNYRTSMLSNGLYQIRANRIGFVTPDNGSTNRFFINAAGNVGIGTTDPLEALHVVGNVRIPSLANCNGVNTVDTDANGNLVCGADVGGGAGDNLGDHTATQNLRMSGFYISNDGDSEGLKVDNSGLVRVGNPNYTSLNSYQFGVNGSIFTAGYLAIRDFDDSAVGADYANFIERDGSMMLWHATNGMVIGGYSDGTTPTIGADSLLVKSKIGVNRAPAYELDVNGNLRATGSGSVFGASGQDTSVYFNAAKNWRIISGGPTAGVGSGNLGFFADTDGTYVMGLHGDNDGVVIGTYADNNTSPPASGLAVSGSVGFGTNNPQQKLHVVGAAVVDAWDNQLFNGYYTGNGTPYLRRSIGGAHGWDSDKLYLNGFNDWTKGVEVSHAPLTTNHTLTAYNAATGSAYDALAGFKSGSAAKGSGIYGELVSGATCAPSSVCAGVYGSNGGNTSAGTWSGYFDGDIMVNSLRIGRGAINQQRNTVVGIGAGASFINPSMDNAAFGYMAMSASTSGGANTAIGAHALRNMTTGGLNTALGDETLSQLTTGSFNTAIGTQSGANITTGQFNTVVGARALLGLTTNSGSTAVGYYALNNGTGPNNTAIGYMAMANYAGANSSTAVGYNALLNVTSGGLNTGIGFGALQNVTTGNWNTALGNGAGPSSGTLSNTTSIGESATATQANMVRIGNTSVTLIQGQVGWSIGSDARLKQNIAESSLGLDFIKQLRPVQYSLINGNGKTDYGFIAQDIEKLLSPDAANMVSINNDLDQTRYLRYNDLFAPIVKAIQEQNQIIEKQGQTINDLTTRLNNLEQKLSQE